MEKARQKVTLEVEKELFLAAKKVALERKTTVDQLVCEHLAGLVGDPGRRRLARARLRRTLATGLIELGGRKCSREELYTLS